MRIFNISQCDHYSTSWDLSWIILRIFILHNIITAVQCTGPLSLTHGVVVPPEDCETALYIPYGTKCIYQCDSGFSLAGPSTSVCQEDGRFSFGNFICEGLNLITFSFVFSHWIFQCKTNYTYAFRNVTICRLHCYQPFRSSYLMTSFIPLLLFRINRWDVWGNSAFV